jgi:hypothetical protein
MKKTNEEKNNFVLSFGFDKEFLKYIPKKSLFEEYQEQTEKYFKFIEVQLENVILRSLSDGDENI